MTNSRLSNHLRAAGDKYPAAWGQVEICLRDRGKDLPDWPRWCFLPLAAFYAIVSGGGNNRIARDQIADVARLGALGIWRYSQGVYRFDNSLYDALIETNLSSEIPVEVLFRLPEWCLYVETPGAINQYGFFAHLEFDVNSGRAELRLLLDTESALEPVILHIGEWTIEEGLERMIVEAEKQSESEFGSITKTRIIEALKSRVEKCLALLLYICSEEPEIEMIDGAYPTRPRPTRTKKGWRMFPAKGPRTWKIGEQIGRKLRSATSERTDGSKRAPHLRRAHWHGYWVGRRDGERRFIYRWLPPIFVGEQDHTDLD